jgi:hypothetical protein
MLLAAVAMSVTAVLYLMRIDPRAGIVDLLSVGLFAATIYGPLYLSAGGAIGAIALLAERSRRHWLLVTAVLTTSAAAGAVTSFLAIHHTPAMYSPQVMIFGAAVWSLVALGALVLFRRAPDRSRT